MPATRGYQPDAYAVYGFCDGFSVSLHSRPTMTTTKVSRKDGTERTKRSLTTTVKSVAYSIEIFENLKPGQPLGEFISESKASFQYDPATDCKKDPERGDCVIAAIERFAKEANRSDLTMGQRRFALKFIVHLVGDITVF